MKALAAMQKTIVLLAATALLAGCALDPIPEGAVKEDREYTTGSNLPKKDRTGQMSKDQVEQMSKGEGRSVTSGPR
jgi:type IV pilus biogenesis protein CpaD/CtpE